MNFVMLFSLFPDLADISFTVNIPVFYFPSLLIFMAFLAIMLIYWIVKWILTIVTGG